MCRSLPAVTLSEGEFEFILDGNDVRGIDLLDAAMTKLKAAGYNQRLAVILTVEEVEHGYQVTVRPDRAVQ